MRDAPGSGAGPSARLRQPCHDLAALLKGSAGGHVQAGLTREPTGAGRCGLQVLEAVTGVRLDGVRDVVAVRDATEQVEQFRGRQGRGSLVLSWATHPSSPRGAADRDGGSSSRGPTLSACPHTGLPCGPCADWRTSYAASASAVTPRSRSSSSGRSTPSSGPVPSTAGPTSHRRSHPSPAGDLSARVRAWLPDPRRLLGPRGASAAAVTLSPCDR